MPKYLHSTNKERLHHNTVYFANFPSTLTGCQMSNILFLIGFKRAASQIMTIIFSISLLRSFSKILLEETFVLLQHLTFLANPKPLVADNE